MSKDGLYVDCHAFAPKKMDQAQTVSRTICTMMNREFCSQCPNSQFVLRFPVAVGHQMVLCPRWENSTAERDERVPPERYVPLRREVCITKSPFEFCTQCPNKVPSEPPRNTDQWYDNPQLRKKGP